MSMSPILKHFKRGCLVVYPPALLIILISAKDAIDGIVLALCHTVSTCLVLYIIETIEKGLCDRDLETQPVGATRFFRNLLAAMRIVFAAVMLVLTVSFCLPQFS